MNFYVTSFSNSIKLLLCHSLQRSEFYSAFLFHAKTQRNSLFFAILASWRENLSEARTLASKIIKT